MQDAIDQLMDVDPQKPEQIAQRLQQSLAHLCELAQLDDTINPLVVANVRICQILATRLNT